MPIFRLCPSPLSSFSFALSDSLWILLKHAQIVSHRPAMPPRPLPRGQISRGAILRTSPRHSPVRTAGPLSPPPSSPLRRPQQGTAADSDGSDGEAAGWVAALDGADDADDDEDDESTSGPQQGSAEVDSGSDTDGTAGARSLPLPGLQPDSELPVYRVWLKITPKNFVGSTKASSDCRIIALDIVSVEALASLIWMEVHQLCIIKGWAYRDPLRKRTVKIKGADKETDWFIKDNPPQLERNNYAPHYFAIAVSKKKFHFKASCALQFILSTTPPHPARQQHTTLSPSYSPQHVLTFPDGCNILADSQLSKIGKVVTPDDPPIDNTTATSSAEGENASAHELHVYIYGAQVKAKTDWEAFKMTLVDNPNLDNAGAAAEPDHQRVVRELKAAHSHHLSTTNNDFAWRSWAEQILALPVHEQAAATAAGVVPDRVARQIRPVAIAQETRRFYRNNALLESLVDAINEQAEDIETVADNLSALVVQCTNEIKLLREQSAHLRGRVSAYLALVDAFEAEHELIEPSQALAEQELEHMSDGDHSRDGA